MVTKEKLTEVMKMNLELCKKNQILFGSIKESRRKQTVISEKESLKHPHLFRRGKNEGKIKLTTYKTFEAAEKHKGSNRRIAVLNFANAFYPGGGCLVGAKAQEECLCRCSTLYECLIAPEALENFYHKHGKMASLGKMNRFGTSDIIYTPGVKVFASDDEIPVFFEDKEEWYDVDVITCAAPQLDPAKKYRKKDLAKVIKRRLERIFLTAIANEDKILILGAFGCGVFANPPELVAKIMKELSEKYKKFFDVIEVAVYDPSKEKKNYEEFYSVFMKTSK